MAVDCWLNLHERRLVESVPTSGRGHGAMFKGPKIHHLAAI